MNIVIASNNRGKIIEFKKLLSPLNLNVIPQKDLNVSEIEEPFSTFIENAIHKARHCSKITGLPSLADDSGLCVPIFGGEPGIYSARYAGENPKSDNANNIKLIKKLNECGLENTPAYFYCTLVFIRHELDPQPIISEGELHGKIINQQKGNGGFGYNPIFYIPQLNKTVAELDDDLKNSISHRGKATQILIDKLKKAYAVDKLNESHLNI